MILPKDKPKRAPREPDISQWPQTTQVFELPKLDFQAHQWVQRGYEIIDSCPNCVRQGIPIPYGKMLMREEGKYTIVDEIKGQ